MELIEEAHRAALDEVRHARIALELAGVDSVPQALPVAMQLTIRPDVRSMALATAREACIGETLSFLEMEREGLPELHSVVEDERRHAALGWRTVRWALEQQPELKDELRAMFAKAPAEIQPLARWLFSQEDEQSLYSLLMYDIGK